MSEQLEGVCVVHGTWDRGLGVGHGAEGVRNCEHITLGFRSGRLEEEVKGVRCHQVSGRSFRSSHLQFANHSFSLSFPKLTVLQ